MKIYFIVILLLLIGCHNGRKSQSLESSVFVGPVNINIKDSLSNIVDCLLLSDAVEDIDIVQLEMEERHLFKKLHNIQVGESDIFIDQGRGVVLNYDRNGKFKKGIGSIGQGPGDFTFSAGIDWNEDLQVLKVLTSYGYNYRIMSYSQENKFISSRKIELPWGGVSVWFDSYKGFDLILRSLLLVDQSEDCSVIAVCKPGDDNVTLLQNPAVYGHEDEYIEHRVDWNDLSLKYWIEYPPQIVHNDEIASVFFSWNDTIYQFNPAMDSLSVRFILQCGERPDFESSHAAMKKDYSFFKYIQVEEMLESQYYMYWKILKGEDCYLLQLDKKYGTITVIKSKATIDTVRINSVTSSLARHDKLGVEFGFTNDLCGGLFFYPDYIDGYYWIDRVEIDDLLKIDIEKLKSETVLFPDKRDKLVKVLENLKEDDHPLLMIATLKK